MTPITLRGRHFSQEELLTIRRLVNDYFKAGRSRISQEICQELDWRQPNGWLKERACRDVLLRLEERGYLRLPPRKIIVAQRKKTPLLAAPQVDDMPQITTYSRPQIELVKGTPNERLWNALVREYHYQSYSVIVGNNLKYLVYLEGVPVACLGWGSAAWSVSARDRWLEAQLGWSREEIKENLPRIINNVRFLILPWVDVKNLASTLLSQMEKVVIKDWQEYYKITPILLETFVEKARFKGTCYKAANWIYIGDTSGSSKKGQTWQQHNNIKYMYIRPLRKAMKKCQYPTNSYTISLGTKAGQSPLKPRLLKPKTFPYSLPSPS